MRPEDSFIPVYYRLEKFLRDQILRGVLKPGDPIPPETQLAHQFATSRMTVRQAFSRLVFEGLIVRHRGRGSFVAPPRLEHTKMWLSFEEEMQARGSKIAHKLLDMRIIPAEGKVAESLALAEGTPITLLQRQRLVDGQVAGLEIRYLPRHIGESLTQDEIHNQPLVPAVERVLGRPRTRLSLRVTASVVRREEAKILETKVGAPVLVRENIWHLDPEGPIQYGKSIFRGDVYQMFVEFSSVPLGPAPPS
ncbi:MAG TPA: GntR family transcriptional regulator [Candidatus Methylomirabilis sp.]|nr:GntR family transcriptional regulator [Candidatus Methylomirabilis sp.]